MRTLIKYLPNQYSLVVDISLDYVVSVKAKKEEKELTIIEQQRYIKPVYAIVHSTFEKLTVELKTRPAILGIIELYFDSGEITYSHDFKVDTFYLV